MRLSLIYEAGMDRRGFLKLLGKGAAASMAPPEAVFKGVAGGLDKLGSLGGLAITKDHIESQLWNLLYSSTQEPELAKFYKEKLDPRITIAMLKKFLFGKMKHGMGGKTADAYYGIDYLYEVSGYDNPNGPLAGFADNLLTKMIDGIGPQRLFDTVLRVAYDRIVNDDGIKSKLLSNILEHHVDRIAYFAETVPSLNQYLLKHGVKVSDLNSRTGDILNVLEKIKALKPEEIQRLRQHKEMIEQREQEQETKDSVQELSPAHLEREVGYEREGQHDPQSSRPAQALGPFESKLKDIFRSIV